MANWYRILTKNSNLLISIIALFALVLILVLLKPSAILAENFEENKEKIVEEKKIDPKGKEKQQDELTIGTTSTTSSTSDEKNPKKSSWQEQEEGSVVSQVDIKKIRKTNNSLDEKERQYEKNLKEQDKLKEGLNKLEKARDKVFLEEYFEATKIDKEIGDLKDKIKNLEEQLKKCQGQEKSKEKKEEPKKESDAVKKELKEQPKEKDKKEEKKGYVVGCNSDSDCNLFYGEGKNTCKSDHKCRCEVGTGELCQRGPTNFKDPKDMTKKERDIFKRMSSYDNFTIQDYKNWLMLYKNDYYLLSDEHLINLKRILRGEPIRLRDIPTSNIYPPDTSQKYFAEMYDKITNSEAVVAPINSATTGIQIGYNYNDYSEFSPPESLVGLRVINGEIERKYRTPSEKNKIFTKDGLSKSETYPVPLEDAIGPYQKLPNI